MNSETRKVIQRWARFMSFIAQEDCVVMDILRPRRERVEGAKLAAELVPNFDPRWTPRGWDVKP